MQKSGGDLAGVTAGGDASTVPNGVLDDRNSQAWTPSHMTPGGASIESASPQRGSPDSSGGSPGSPEPTVRGHEYRVLFGFNAEEGEELSVARGQSVWTVDDSDSEDEDPGWMRVVDENGSVGVVPETYVQLV